MASTKNTTTNDDGIIEKEEDESALRRLLTEMASPDDKPLFENGPALARYISGKEGGKYYGRVKTLGAAITKIFIAERSIPKSLNEDIQSAVQDRLAAITPSIGEAEIKVWLRRTADALDLMQSIHDRRLRSNAGIPRSLQNATKSAENRFVISPLTAIARQSPTGLEMMKIIVGKLGLSTSQQVPAANYTFCYASEREAVDFWRDLFRIKIGQLGDALGEELDHHIALEKFRTLDETGVLRVFEIDPRLCLTPGVIYDPGSKNCRGFITLYHASSDKFDISELPVEYLSRWEQVYWEINAGVSQNCGILNRIRFRDWEAYIATESARHRF